MKYIIFADEPQDVLRQLAQYFGKQKDLHTRKRDKALLNAVQIVCETTEVRSKKDEASFAATENRILRNGSFDRQPRLQDRKMDGSRTNAPNTIQPQRRCGPLEPETVSRKEAETVSRHGSEATGRRHMAERYNSKNARSTEVKPRLPYRDDD